VQWALALALPEWPAQQQAEVYQGPPQESVLRGQD
jgi:hypothetical protein